MYIINIGQKTPIKRDTTAKLTGIDLIIAVKLVKKTKNIL